jgi:hypothetical protein
MEEAVRGLDLIAASYEQHCAAARRIAEELFAASKVMNSILERSGVNP